MTGNDDYSVAGTSVVTVAADLYDKLLLKAASYIPYNYGRNLTFQLL